MWKPPSSELLPRSSALIRAAFLRSVSECSPPWLSGSSPLSALSPGSESSTTEDSRWRGGEIRFVKAKTLRIPGTRECFAFRAASAPPDPRLVPRRPLVVLLARATGAAAGAARQPARPAHALRARSMGTRVRLAGAAHHATTSSPPWRRGGRAGRGDTRKQRPPRALVAMPRAGTQSRLEGLTLKFTHHTRACQDTPERPRGFGASQSVL